MIKRSLEPKILTLLKNFPAVALLGPRQIGKTTLALQVAQHLDPQCLYLDLERPSHLAQLQEPEQFFLQNQSKLVILDEIQRVPKLFEVLKVMIDIGRQKGLQTGQYLLLGSASKDLLQQTSESLAGRIVYCDLYPLNILETGQSTQEQLWLRGGYPTSFLSSSDQVSFTWRDSLITTYIERDIPTLGPNIASDLLRRFWTMVGHCQGGLLNASNLAESLDISNMSVARYLSLFVDLFFLRKLRPWSRNVGKRLVKTPKIYIRDTGLLHTLLGITTINDLLSHPIIGHSWEGFVLENIASVLDKNILMSFYRSSGGAEVDLVLEYPSNEIIAIEMKRSLTPTMTKSLHEGITALKPKQTYIVYPGQASYNLSHNVQVMPLYAMLEKLSQSI